jgi:putative heme transporter
VEPRSPLSSAKSSTSSSRRGRLLRRAIAVAIVIVAFVFVLPRLADYGEVWAEVKQLDTSAISLLVAVTVMNLATFAPPWMAVLPALGFRRAFVMTQASTASTYVAPGGAAVGIGLSYVFLRRWGYNAGEVGRAVALTGLWNQLTLLGFPAVALGLLTLTGGQSPLLKTVALLGLGVFVAAFVAFALAMSSDRLAARVGARTVRLVSGAFRIVRRQPPAWSAESFVRFRRNTVGLLRRRWLYLTIATLAGQLAVFLVLLASLGAVGVSGSEVSLVEAFAAWSIVRLLGSLPITPGGIGIVEVGLTTSLAGFGGDESGVVAAVLIYRFLTVVPTLALGGLAAVVMRRLAPTP